MARDAVLCLRLPKNLKDALQAMADADSRSLSSMAVMVLEEVIQKRPGQASRRARRRRS